MRQCSWQIIGYLGSVGGRFGFLGRTNHAAYRFTRDQNRNSQGGSGEETSHSRTYRGSDRRDKTWFRVRVERKRGREWQSSQECSGSHRGFHKKRGCVGRWSWVVWGARYVEGKWREMVPNQETASSRIRALPPSSFERMRTEKWKQKDCCQISNRRWS